jgi:hypothetical protein
VDVRALLALDDRAAAGMADDLRRGQDGAVGAERELDERRVAVDAGVRDVQEGPREVDIGL